MTYCSSSGVRCTVFEVFIISYGYRVVSLVRGWRFGVLERLGMVNLDEIF